jgi:nucleoside-diphosphate-sugar epimerase
MKVLVAGAAGAAGVPTVRALLASGHEVVGTTRSAGKTQRIEELGARSVVMDALATASARQALEATRPDAVVQLLTALPTRGPTREAHLNDTNRLRIDGTRNLIAAAVATGANRYISESIVIGYGSGDSVFTEEDPFARAHPGMPLEAVQLALASLEEQVLNTPGIEGIVLRMGLYYGPTSGSTEFLRKMIKRRLLRLPPSLGVVPWIHLEDVGSAVVAALERGRAGEVYNIVDDEPIGFGSFAAELAAAERLRPPGKIPRWLARVTMPYVASGLDTRLRVSNAKAKRELGWTLRYPTVREGLKPRTAS